MLPLSKDFTIFIIFNSTQVSTSDTNSAFYYQPVLVSTEAGFTTKDFSLNLANGKIGIKTDDDDLINAKSGNITLNSPKIITNFRRTNIDPTKSADIHLRINGNYELKYNATKQSNNLNANNTAYNGIFYGLSIGAVAYDANGLFSSSAFDGEISEIIIYERQLAESEISKIHTYLGIKYGVTLTKGQISYINSKNNFIWESSIFKNYNKQIFGIGKDNLSALSQPKSTSTEPFGGDLILEADATLDDQEYVTCATNSDSMIWDSLPTTSNYASKYQKNWQTQITGNLNFRAIINQNKINPAFSLDELALVLDDDGNFENGKQQVLKVEQIQDSLIQFPTITTTDLSYFSLFRLKPEINIYNYYTPNNDGFNDIFKIKNIEYYPTNQLTIYSIEGRKIEEIQNFKNGDLLLIDYPNGHYLYTFQYNNKEIKGGFEIEK